MTVTISKSKNSNSDETRLVIRDTMLMYCKHTKFGCLKFGEIEDTERPHFNMQWETDVVISKDIAAKLLSLHKKFKAKTWTQAEFKETFKVDAPVTDETIYTFKPYQEAFYKQSGDPAPRLKVINKQREDLSEVEIGNGSTATVIIAIKNFDNKFGKGTSMRLKAIQVTNLVEYTSSDNFDDDFDYDEDEFSEGQGDDAFEQHPQEQYPETSKEDDVW